MIIYMVIGGVIMYRFQEEHFKYIGDKLIFEPCLNFNDYEIMQGLFEAERNIGALARLGLKDHPLKLTILRNSIIKTAHFTTKIERNKLEYKEVEDLYNQYRKKVQVSYKDKVRLEVSNVFTTYDFIYTLNPYKEFSDLSENILIKIHALLMDGLSEYPQGYRPNQVNLKDDEGNISYIPPDQNKIGQYMSAFFGWLYTSVTGYENQYSDKLVIEKKVHPLILSAIAHHVIGYIHPFPDGNGRTARAYSTLIAFLHQDIAQIKDAFSVEEFFDKNIEIYYDTLMTATQGDLKQFIIFYLDCVNQTLSKVLEELQRYNKIKHVRELLGKGHAATMFEIISRMEDGETFERNLFDKTLDASTSSITKNLNKLKDLGIINPTGNRGEYIVNII